MKRLIDWVAIRAAPDLDRAITRERDNLRVSSKAGGEVVLPLEQSRLFRNESTGCMVPKTAFYPWQTVDRLVLDENGSVVGVELTGRINEGFGLARDRQGGVLYPRNGTLHTTLLYEPTFEHARP